MNIKREQHSKYLPFAFTREEIGYAAIQKWRDKETKLPPPVAARLNAFFIIQGYATALLPADYVRQQQGFVVSMPLSLTLNPIAS